MKKTVAVIFGGKSSEHEVSIRSAKNIANALDKSRFQLLLVGISKEGTWYQLSGLEVFDQIKRITDKALPAQAEPVTLMSFEGKPYLYSLKSHGKTLVDCAFPVLHGTFGEDGTIQGLFKMVNVPFVGCGVWSSSTGMDKEVMKRLLTFSGVTNAKYEVLTPQHTPGYQELVKKLGSPFFIKPANAGSSVGVHKIKTAADFESGLKDAFSYDAKVLAEEFVQGRELECSVMGLNESPKASVPGEVVAHHEFYSYEAKYVDDKGATIIIPAKLTTAEIEKIQKIAVQTYQILGCDGLTRVDFFMKANGDVYVNEINTLPGFTNISMYPKMWEASGIPQTALMSQLVDLAFAKKAQEDKLLFSYLAMN